MNTYESLRQRYRKADFLQPRHVEVAQRFVSDWTQSRVEAFTADNITTCHLGETAFQLLIHTPSDPSDQVIAVPTGYGTGLGVNALVRAMTVREAVDPHATLLVQGNASPFYLTNNFSPGEEDTLEQGDFAPMRARLNVGLKDISGRLPDANVAYVGGSLGAAVVGSALGHAEEMALQSNGGTIVDPANIMLRERARLAADFTQDLGEMALAGASNYSLDWWLQDRWPRKRRGSARLSAIDVALREAYYIAGALGRAQLPEDLRTAPREVGIVHMWAQRSRVSPDRANLPIARKMKASGHLAYQPVRITNHHVGHGVTTIFSLQAAALERAMELSHQEQNSVQ